MFSTSSIGKLKLRQIFLVLSIIALILASIPSYLYLSEVTKRLDAYSSEQTGLKAVTKVLLAIQLTQQHRGLSALHLNDISGANEKRLLKQTGVDEAYSEVNINVVQANIPAFQQRWTEINKDWNLLKLSVAQKALTESESFNQHVALLEKLMSFNELVGDHYGLSLNADKDTYHLIQATFYQMPSLAEELGQLRAKGASLLAKKTASSADQLTISMIMARVGDRAEQTRSSFTKAGAANDKISSELGSIASVASLQLKDLLTTASNQILKNETLTFEAEKYVDIATKAIDSQFAFNSAAGKYLSTHIAMRVDEFQQLRAKMLLAMTLIAALASYFVWTITQAITSQLTRAIEIAQNIARGNLVNEFGKLPDNEIGRMLRALQEMNASLRAMVSDVRSSIEYIGAATSEIAAGNTDVSARLETQASNLEETASSMEQLTSTVAENADNARRATELVHGALNAATDGHRIVTQVVSTMNDINDSSRKVVEIIAVIDGIAFQTNILALNAAVEAARAGEQGRGFAVVASEVRNLAHRSAAAAKQIKDLISHSVERVDAGNMLVGETGNSMDIIQERINKIATIMSEIAFATKEQSAGISQVNEAVTQIDDMTQQNAALVEQTAAASSSLHEQTEALVKSMSNFTLPQNRHSTSLQRTSTHPYKPPKPAHLQVQSNDSVLSL